MAGFLRQKFDLTTDDIEALLRNEVREDDQIEYKLAVPGKANSEKSPFLQAICSFANTNGGDLLLGISASDGIAKELIGMPADDVDRAKLQLEQLIQTSISPRLTPAIKEIKLSGKKSILAVRVNRSWLAPHRVNTDGHFYGRNSAGKYQMDIDQLRSAFSKAGATADRINAFTEGFLERGAQPNRTVFGLPAIDSFRLIRMGQLG